MGEELAAGTHRGHEAITQACTRTFSGRSDAVRVVTVIDATAASATFDYAWSSAPRQVAGQMIIKWSDELINGMIVTL